MSNMEIVVIIGGNGMVALVVVASTGVVEVGATALLGASPSPQSPSQIPLLYTLKHHTLAAIADTAAASQL